MAELNPKIMVLGPPPYFHLHEKLFPEEFNFLKPWESPLPLLQFLSTYASSARALLCSAFTPVTADILRKLPELRFIVTTSVGVNHIDLPECRRRGISIANAPQIFSEDVADLAVGLLIDVLRRISGANRFVKSGFWPRKGDYPLGSKLGGKRVGIVGLGSIGLEVARRLEGFGCIISYNSRKQKSSIPYPFCSDVRQLAADCDILIICCALTDETRHMINKEILMELGKEGVIVNVARGAIIDEKELIQCLVEDEIAGAGLDVFENEPYVPEELIGLENVVLSSHHAVYTREGWWICYKLMSENLEAFFSKRSLLSPLVVVDG